MKKIKPEEIAPEDMQKLRKLQEAFGNHEPLDPELEAYLFDHHVLGKCIQHPLVYSVPHSDHLNGLMNKSLAYKRAMLKKAIDDVDVSRYVFMHERPYRAQAFISFTNITPISSREYWGALSDIWMDSENIYQNIQFWKERFSLSSLKDMDKKHLFMNPQEREFYDSLPEVVTCWRGYQHRLNANGLSYTLDKERAEWFANRFAGKFPMLKEAQFAKAGIFAYLNGRNEHELVVTGKPLSVKITPL